MWYSCKWEINSSVTWWPLRSPLCLERYYCAMCGISKNVNKLKMCEIAAKQKTLWRVGCKRLQTNASFTIAIHSISSEKKKKSKRAKKTALQRSFLHMSKTTAFWIKFWVLQLSCQDKFVIDNLNFLFTSINFFSI